MPKSLSIKTTPYQGSRLAIPPSPFSPRYPITPPTTPPKHSTFPTSTSGPLPIPPPENPLHWLWQCHLCRQTYKLGTTRRCLEDGHRFCAGVTVVKTSGSKTEVKRHRACASEFDYQGWQVWGDWRRNVAEIRAVEEMEPTNAVSPRFWHDMADEMLKGINANINSRTESAPPEDKLAKKKNCSAECDYPSQCRWGRQPQLLAEATQGSVAAVPQLEELSVPIQAPTEPKRDFDAILADLQRCSSNDEHGAHVVEQLPSDDRRAGNNTEDSPVRESSDLLANLVESAKQRKRKSASGLVTSPLAANPPTTQLSSSAAAHEWDTTTSTEGASRSLAQKLDDFETEIRKSFEMVTSMMRRDSGYDSGVSKVEGEKKVESVKRVETLQKAEDRRGVEKKVVKGLKVKKRIVHF